MILCARAEDINRQDTTEASARSSQTQTHSARCRMQFCEKTATTGNRSHDELQMEVIGSRPGPSSSIKQRLTSTRCRDGRTDGRTNAQADTFSLRLIMIHKFCVAFLHSFFLVVYEIKRPCKKLIHIQQCGSRGEEVFFCVSVCVLAGEGGVRGKKLSSRKTTRAYTNANKTVGEQK